MFSKMYGYIAELMYIPVNYFALRAIIKFWDPAYSCFTFDLLPTIEEYQAMLSMSGKERKIIYFFNHKQTTKRTLSKFLETVHATKIQKHIKVNGGEEIVSFDYLIKTTHPYFDEDKGLTLLALCIYGAVIFPKAEVYVNGKVNGGEEIVSFNCCVPLLYIWIHNYIKFPVEFRCPRLDFSSP